MNDLGHYLASRGHDVTVISSSPDGAQSREDGPVHQILRPQRLKRLGRLRQLNGFHAFAFECRSVLMHREFDAVHCLNYHDAWGALRARKALRARGGGDFRVVYQMTGVPVARYFRSIPIDALMFREVVRSADDVIVLSRFAADCLRRDFGREGVLLPSPTVTAPFEAEQRNPPPYPRILFVGDLDEPRKGAILLARAFAQVRRDHPQAELAYSGRCSETTRAAISAALPEDMRESVIFHGIGKVGDLPGLFASATVVVNPAIWEALGNVLIEALAAGTPVVGCNHAGIPDIIADPRIGAVFEPGETVAGAASNVEGLARALLQCIALAAQPGTEALCRLRAHAFGWDRLGPAYEALLAGAAVSGPAGEARERIPA